jgi:acyl carrier protein
MLPTTYIHLDQLPHTPNGKLDRNALPKPRFDRGRRKHVEPANEIERHLVEIVADLLAIDRVSVEDDFFELGAHSLLALQAISRIRAGLGIDVPVRLLFENPSVRQLAEALSEAERSDVASASIPRRARTVYRAAIPDEKRTTTWS